MKQTTTFLILILTFSMFLPVFHLMQNASYEDTEIRVVDEVTTLAATPGSDVHVIRVSDDVFINDGAPDSNYAHSPFGLICGKSVSEDLFRTWLKFNLTHIPRNVQFTRATLNLFIEISWTAPDEPFGVYYSENDTWTEEDITWNNAPEYDPVPLDVIDSPSSPNMFVTGMLCEWEITTEILQSLSEDGMITLVVGQVNETPSTNSENDFFSRETSITSETNKIPNIALEYSLPSATDLAVDGYSESPQIDYINSANPEFGWTFDDTDPNDFQKNYELEVWNSSSFDETQLMNENNSEITTVYDTADAGVQFAGDTFNSPNTWRVQYKWPSSMITQSGVVDRLILEVDGLTGTSTYSDLAIYMVCVESSSALDYNFESNYDGRTPIQVLNRSEYTAITEDGFMVFDIENTFTVTTDLDLIIEMRHTGASGTSLKGNITISTGGSFAASGATLEYSGTDAGTIQSVTQGLKLELASNEVYSGGVSTNLIPFGLSLGAFGRFQFKYNQSLIDDEGIIDRILFPAGLSGDVIYENFSVYLVETTHEGLLDHTNMDNNYAGASPTLVLSADEYIIRDIGQMLVIDVDDLFFYSNTNDLIIELRFDSLVDGNQRAVYTADGGGYRAYDSAPYYGNDTSTYNMLLDFIYQPNSIEYSGTPLVNATTYYWRVRTYDSIGIWSSWSSASFKYELLESIPLWSNLVETTSPIELGESMTISINVTHTTGINQVLLEYDSINHTMTKLGDTFSYTWTPDSAGTIPYTVYMEPFSGTGTMVSDSVGVADTTAPMWNPPPADKVLVFGEALSYQLTAADLSGIGAWTINDTANFEIIDGLVTNNTILAQGAYILNVTVSDNEANSLSGTFVVAVIGNPGDLELDPEWSNHIESSNALELGESITISIDVTHASGIDNVQLEFLGANHTMSKDGDIFSFTWIPESTGTISYTIYMESNEGTSSSTSDSFGVVDTTGPEWVSEPSDKILLFGSGLDYQLSATDLSGIANWTIDDTVNFEIIEGLITNKTILNPGVYSLNVTVTDNEGNSLSGEFTVSVIFTSDSTTTTTTTTTSPTSTDTTTTSPTAPPDFFQLDWTNIGLIGVIVVLVFVLIIQHRKD